MNHQVREKLCRMLAAYGADLHADPRRCEALLKDLCPQDKCELSVLIGALREHVPADLASPTMRRGAVHAIGRLAKRLEDNLGLASKPARWAVESWAVALGVVTEKQLVAAKPKSPPPARVTPPPVIVTRSAPRSLATNLRSLAIALAILCVTSGAVVAVAWKAPQRNRTQATAATKQTNVVLLPQESPTQNAPALESPRVEIPTAAVAEPAIPTTTLAARFPSELPPPISDEEAEIVQGALHATAIHPAVDRLADR